MGKRRRKLLLCTSLFVLAAGFLGIWRFRGGPGTVLLPERESKLPDLVWFSQRDPAWAGDRLGESGDTMGESGCLVSALAAGLDMEAKEKGMNFYMTAGELNQLFSQAGAYTDGGALRWDEAGKALPGAEVLFGEHTEAKTVDRILAQGHFPAVKVRVGGWGAFHWVLIAGADGESYWCVDPLGESAEFVSLEEFGNRVYAVRVMCWAE